MPSPFWHDSSVSTPALPCASSGSWPLSAFEPWLGTCTRRLARCLRRQPQRQSRRSEPWPCLTSRAPCRCSLARTQATRTLIRGGSGRSACPATTWDESSSCSILEGTFKAMSSTIVGPRALHHSRPACDHHPSHRHPRVHRLGVCPRAHECAVGSPWPRWRTIRQARQSLQMECRAGTSLSELTQVAGHLLGQAQSMWSRTSPLRTRMTARRTMRPTTPTSCTSRRPTIARGPVRRNMFPSDTVKGSTRQARGLVSRLQGILGTVLCHRPHRPAPWPCGPCCHPPHRCHRHPSRWAGMAPTSLLRLRPGAGVEVQVGWTTAKGISSRRRIEWLSFRPTGPATTRCRTGAESRWWC